MALLPVANGTGAFSRFLNGQNVSVLDGDSSTPCAYRTSDFMHVGVWMPGTGNIGYGGLGYWPGSFIWLNGASGKVTMHETGHNIALGHASTISPGATTLNEYGELRSGIHGSNAQLARCAVAQRFRRCALLALQLTARTSWALPGRSRRATSRQGSSTAWASSRRRAPSPSTR